jgi:hypothetical protein
VRNCSLNGLACKRKQTCWSVVGPPASAPPATVSAMRIGQHISDHDLECYHLGKTARSSYCLSYVTVPSTIWPAGFVPFDCTVKVLPSFASLA